MARIRSIKPEFPQSETIGSLSRDARLLFIQLWTLADDSGRSRASSRVLASLLYPFDDDAKDLIGGWLDELETKGCIRRYAVDGNSYLDIPNWLKHQKIDHPGKSHIPEFSETLAKPRETLAPDLGPRTKDLVPKKDSCAPRRTDGLSDVDFEKFKSAYPRRKGAKDWQEARKRLATAVRDTPLDAILLAAESYSAELRQTGKADSEFVKMPSVWLNKRSYLDYSANAQEPAEPTRKGVYVEFSDPARDAWDAYGRANNIKYPVDKRGGWEFPTRWPPGYETEPNWPQSEKDAAHARDADAH